MGMQPLDDSDGPSPSQTSSHENIARELLSEEAFSGEQGPAEPDTEQAKEPAWVELTDEDLFSEEVFSDELIAQEQSSEEPEPSESSAQDPDEDISGTDELVLTVGTFDEPTMQEYSPADATPEDPEAEAIVEIVEQAITDAPVATQAKAVSETEFEHVVDDALEAVGGVVLFKMRIDEDGENKHVAAASIGDGERRQFLLLTLPATGGTLKVESVSHSEKPLAKLAKAYVGVVEAFRSAA